MSVSAENRKGIINMKVPYALQDFKNLREQGYLYVDKTKYIEIMENMSGYILFLRPRRFGKTLFASVLEYYYDIFYKEDFDNLFGELYIGKNKTESANSYHVLKISFTGIHTEKSRIEKSFANCVRTYLMEFVNFHKLDIKVNEDSDESSTILREFFKDYKNASDKKIYLIIDEYDLFANDVLTEDREFFNQMTGKDGFLRKFYEVFKAYAGNTVDKIFITGVTPITLDSLTSGFNIVSNLGNHELLNEMIGFTEEDVRFILKKYNMSEDYINILREHYNGYLFHEDAKNRVYNSCLLMYFVWEYVISGKLPKNLVDANVISDYTRLTKLFDLYEDTADKKEIIEDIVAGNKLNGTIKDRIGPLVKSDSDPASEDRLGFTRDDFLSLLFYLGLLTVSEPVGTYVRLAAPNYCISSVYSRYYLSYLYNQMKLENIMSNEVDRAMRNVILKHDFTRYKEVVEKLLKGISNADYIEFDEKYVKLMMYSVARYSDMYLVKTEYEIDGMRADLVWLPNQVINADYYYIFEVKYLKKKEYTEKRLEQERQDAIEQLTVYANTQELKNIPNLRKYVVVAVKDELKVFEEISL